MPALSDFGFVPSSHDYLGMFKAKHTRADEAFRGLLRDLRKDRRLSQAELSRLLGVPQSYVSKYETGERRLDFVETAYVCGAFEMSIEEFAQLFLRKLTDARRQKVRRSNEK